jgi:hypothetical protein
MLKKLMCNALKIWDKINKKHLVSNLETLDNRKEALLLNPGVDPDVEEVDEYEYNYTYDYTYRYNYTYNYTYAYGRKYNYHDSKKL